MQYELRGIRALGGWHTTQVLRPSFWYQKLGRRTWVVCHGPYTSAVVYGPRRWQYRVHSALVVPTRLWQLYCLYALKGFIVIDKFYGFIQLKEETGQKYRE